MNIDFRFYGQLLFRRLPVMMALLIVCSGIGFAVAMRLPTTYYSEARLLVEGAQIPDDLAPSTVNTSASEEIGIIRQRLMTRANLIDIASDFRVFDPAEGLSPDQIVSEMRARTTIATSGGNRRGVASPIIVNVGFSTGDPRVAANIVNEYVTRIIAANIELRTGVAGETLDFFEQEVDRLNTELDLRSAAISRFQSENAGALPDNLEFRQNRQAFLQERIANFERRLETLRNQRERIVSIFETTGQLATAQEANLSPAERELRQLEAEMESALTIYSPTNPRVLVLQNRIETLRSRIASEAGAENAEDATRALFDAQIAEIDGEIATTEVQLAEAEQEAATVADAIARTPANAIALDALRRDYDNIRRQYDTAVSRLAQAGLGERIELTSRGRRIVLIEPATVPTSPASPNRPMIAATGVGAGLGMALGLFVLLELLNRRVRRPAEISSGLGILPLATIPYIESARRRRLRRGLRIASLIVVITGVPAALWAIDTYYMPLDLLATRLLERFGLA